MSNLTDTMKPIAKGGRAHRVGCDTPRCRGTAYSVWNAPARLAMYFGRLHYKCDTCGSSFSVKVTDGDGT